MRRLLPLLLTLVTFLVVAQPRVSTFELESNVVTAASIDDALALAFANGSIAVFSMPNFEPLGRVKLAYEARPIGMGFLGSSRLAVALSDGTIVYLDPRSGAVLGAEKAIEVEAYRAVVGGRWAIFLQKYDYRTGKGSAKFDRLLVYDTNLKAVTFAMDRSTGTLVYAFDVKIVGNLMLLTWIDTTCEICRLDDTFVTLLNLSTYDYVFVERFGECRIDADSHAMVAVRVYDGKGLYYDVLRGRKSLFEVPGRPLDVRVVGGVGYVLTRDPSTGVVALYRVYSDAAVKLANLSGDGKGYSLFVFEGELGVVTSSFIAVKGFNFSPATYPIPWAPRVVAEGRSWAAVLYGRSLLSLVRASNKMQVDVTIVSEPYASIRVREVGIVAQAGSDGVAFLKLPPGSYTIEAWKEGFEPRVAHLIVGTGSREVAVTLELKRVGGESQQPISFGVLNVTVLGADEAVIEILNERGQIVNITISRTLLLRLKPGDYQVVARVDGCSNRINVRVGPDATQHVMLRLECHATQPTDEVSVGIVNSSVIRERLAEYTQLDYRLAKSLSLPTVRDLEGRAVDLSRGVKVLVFFYTKCLGCSLLVERLKGLSVEAPVEIIMVAPATYDDEGTLRTYAAEVNASGWLWVLDEGNELTMLFNVTAFPTVVLLNYGRVEFMGVGAAEEAYYLAATLLENLSKVLNVVRDPAVIAVIVGLLFAYLGREEAREEREV